MQDQIFADSSDYPRRERCLAQRTVVSHLPAIRRFLNEVCPAGADDLGKISQADVTCYIESHARDWSPKSAKALCWSLPPKTALERAGISGLAHQGAHIFRHSLATELFSLWRNIAGDRPAVAA